MQEIVFFTSIFRQAKGIQQGLTRIAKPYIIDDATLISQLIQRSPGGDSLSIPLGSTDTIRLSDFLNPDDIEMLKVMENGGYGFTKKDSIDKAFTDIIQKDLKIQDQTFTEDQTISFGDISLDDFVIPAISKDTSISLVASSVSMGDFAVPSVSKEETYPAGMSANKFNAPTINDTTVNGGKNDALEDLILPAYPGYSDIELPIRDTVLPSFTSTNSINYIIDVPEGVTGINRIELSDSKAKPVMEVSIQLAGASTALHEGVVIPNITINPSDLFIFSVETPMTGGVIRFDSNTPLNKGNNYEQAQTFDIDAFNVTSAPSGGKLTMLKNMVASGTLSVTGATIMSENLSFIKGCGYDCQSVCKKYRY